MVMQSKPAIRTSNIATTSLSGRSNRSSDIALIHGLLHLNSGAVNFAKFGLHVGKIKYTYKKINKYMLSSLCVQLYLCIVPNIICKKNIPAITGKIY
jgi:hypothetical protein